MPLYDLSNNLKHLRLKNGWNQEDVANQLDISIPAYSKIETAITDINLSRLEQIAKLYNITVIQLLTGDNTPELKEIAVLKDLLIKRDEEIIELQKELLKIYKKSHL